LINTLFHAVRGEEFRIVCEPTDVMGDDGTLNYVQVKLREALNGEISLYDSRGFNFININDMEEIFKFTSGSGSKGYVTRTRIPPTTLTPEIKEQILREEKLIKTWESRFRNNKTANPLNASIFVISSESLNNSTEMKNISTVLRFMRQAKNENWMVVITRVSPTDPSSKTVIANFSKELMISSTKIFLIENYDHNNFSPNPITELQALKILKNCCVLAEKYYEYTPPSSTERFMSRSLISLRQSLRELAADISAFRPITQIILFFFVIVIFAYLRTLSNQAQSIPVKIDAMSDP
jgi:hypothetical protein